jgi:lipoprotein-anchoring transpeptidase ErfK/SrfK
LVPLPSVLPAATPPKKPVPKAEPAPNPFQALFAPKPVPVKPGAGKPVGKPQAKPAVKAPVKAKPVTRPSITPAKSGSAPTGSPFAKPKTYPMSEVSMNHRLLSQFNGSNSRMVVDLGKQKAYLLVNGKIALTTPISSARAGMVTPTGEYRMSERVRSGKISNLYHVGMPFWMRLGSTPFGTHAGYLPGYPASHGCIRLPYSVAETIFDHTSLGTPVSVYRSWNSM